MAEEVYRYWIFFRDGWDQLTAGEFVYDFELNTRENIEKAETLGEPDGQRHMTIFTWKRLQ